MKERIISTIKSALENLNIQECNFAVDYSDNPKHGDYATNIALVAAKNTNI